MVPEEFRRGVADNEAEVRRKVDYLLDNGVDLIKVIATGAVLTAGTEPGSPNTPRPKSAPRWRKPASAVSSSPPTRMAPRASSARCCAGVRSIEHGSLIDDEGIALMKQHGTWLDADIYNGDYIDTVGRAAGWPEEVLRKNTRDHRRAARGFPQGGGQAGVNLSFGTDAGVYPHGDNARQFAYMVKYGMTPLQAIRAATINSATLLGKEKELGSISVGKAADLVALQCDPLQDVECLHQVRGVVKAGQPVALE